MDFCGAFAQTVDAAARSGRCRRIRILGDVAYPDRNREYQLEWNTREVTGEAPASYRFQYGDRPPRE